MSAKNKFFVLTPSLIYKLIQFLFPFLREKFIIRQKYIKEYKYPGTGSTSEV